ncbi:MAG: TIGR01777 family oxidoreductase [Verrucomicrobiota bacterium]
MNPKRIVIAGGSGFIGSALAREFTRRGYAVAVLTRSPRGRRDGVSEVAWDGRTIDVWAEQLDGAEAVINLTGKNINCPHTPTNLHALTVSRVDSVNAIAAAIAACKTPPSAWIQASAIGFYGDTGDRLCTESAPNGGGDLGEICRAWETAFSAARVPATRKVTLRIGFVLGRDGGALPVLSRLTRFYLGGEAGNGRQYISWIHLGDLVQMFVMTVEQSRFFGVFNAVAPDAMTNAEFMGELRKAVHRPWSPPVPEFAIRLGSRLMGSEASLVLMSSCCAPERFLAGKFKFRFPNLKAALNDLCRKSQ